MFMIATTSPPLLRATSVRANLVSYSRKIPRYLINSGAETILGQTLIEGMINQIQRPKFFILISCQKHK